MEKISRNNIFKKWEHSKYKGEIKLNYNQGTKRS